MNGPNVTAPMHLSPAVQGHNVCGLLVGGLSVNVRSSSIDMQRQHDDDTALALQPINCDAM